VRRRDALRRAVTGDLSLLKELSIQKQSSDPLDAVQDEVSSQLVEIESRELSRIEYALERMREGLYGVCEGCGANIPTARLNALPYAIHCITYQREIEKGAAQQESMRLREELASSRIGDDTDFASIAANELVDNDDWDEDKAADRAKAAFESRDHKGD